MDLQYPIGRPQFPEVITMEHIQAWIDDIEQAPKALCDAVDGLSSEQLDTPYRPEGWTVRQVVHHLPDSHMVTYLNFRTALCQDGAPMKSADVNGWAALVDSLTADVAMSVQLFTSLHQRWVALMKSMDQSDFDKAVVSAKGTPRSLVQLLGIYAWHGKHHVAHITSLRERMGW